MEVIKMRKKKSKLYPTQIKYLAKNPIVSCHIPAEKKEELSQLAAKQNKTLSQFIRDLLLNSLKEKKRYGVGQKIKNLFKS